MTLQQIRYFIAVAECGSISAAAKKLFISQSSISEAIKEIESTYGITAFNRHSRGIQLTRDGDELLVELMRIQHHLEYLDERYSMRQNGRTYYPWPRNIISAVWILLQRF